MLKNIYLKHLVRTSIKKALIPLYQVLNLFFLPFLRAYYFKKIEKVPRSTQLFFMTRFDLGPCFLLMHYAQCWHEERGAACLVIFTTHMKKIVEFSKEICPDVQIIHFDNWFSRSLFFFFKNEIPQFFTLLRIYSYACCRWPHALFLYDMVFSRAKDLNVSCYISAFDPILKQSWPFSPEFLKAYLKFREVADYRRHVFKDMIRLHYKRAQNKSMHTLHFSDRTKNLFEKLKIEFPYVVMNVNCKNYGEGVRNNRRIHYPERYSGLIDFLISKGYSVVIQGRNEQPSFRPRKKLIEYFKSSEASPTNDVILCANSSFGIFNKTGPSILCGIKNIPVLGLDFVELATTDPNGRCRFFPKYLWDKKDQAYVHWKDWLTRPCYYDLGCVYHETNLIEYVDLEEEELIGAAEEFIPLLSLPPTAWTQYSPLQAEYKKSIHPAHLDLYELIDVPCDAYLKSKKFK